MGTATTKDVSSIKNRGNQLITAQNTQQETLVHIISVLNITRYATQVTHQHSNEHHEKDTRIPSHSTTSDIRCTPA